MKVISVTEFRNLPPFNSILLKGIGDVHLSLGNEQKFSFEASEKIARNLVAEVTNNELIISYNSNFPVELLSNHKLHMYIITNTVNSLVVSGAGKIIGTGRFTLPTLKIKNSGVGSITLDLDVKNVETILSGLGKICLSGKADNHILKLSGAGKVEAFNLLTQNTSVDSKGVGKCKIHVINKLDAVLSGVGKIEYKGNPPIFNCNRSGVGVIQKVD